METSPQSDENQNASPAQRPTRKPKGRRLERDMFGDEFLGSRRVLHVTLDLDELPEGARTYLKTLVAVPLEFSAFETLIHEAMAQVPATFWEEELERYSPDEWKLLRALANDEFRQKVETLLSKNSPLQS